MLFLVVGRRFFQLSVVENPRLSLEFWSYLSQIQIF